MTSCWNTCTSRFTPTGLCQVNMLVWKANLWEAAYETRFLEERLEEIKQNTQILTLWHIIALYPRLRASKPPKNSNYCRYWSDRGESSASMRDDKGDEKDSDSLSQKLLIKPTLPPAHTCSIQAAHCRSIHFTELNMHAYLLKMQKHLQSVVLRSLLISPVFHSLSSTLFYFSSSPSRLSSPS